MAQTTYHNKFHKPVPTPGVIGAMWLLKFDIQHSDHVDEEEKIQLQESKKDVIPINTDFSSYNHVSLLILFSVPMICKKQA